MNYKHFVGLVAAVTLFAGATAFGQQAPSGDPPAMPPDQPAATDGQPSPAPQPSEIEEQQIEQQQAAAPQSPG